MQYLWTYRLSYSSANGFLSYNVLLSVDRDFFLSFSYGASRLISTLLQISGNTTLALALRWSSTDCLFKLCKTSCLRYTLCPIVGRARSSTVAKNTCHTTRSAFIETENKAYFTCLYSVPVGAPSTHLESTGPNSMRVSWDPLPSNLSRGEVTEYKVQWGRRGKPFHESEVVGAAAHDFTITGNYWKIRNTNFITQELLCSLQGSAITDIRQPLSLLLYKKNCCVISVFPKRSFNFLNAIPRKDKLNSSRLK